MSYCFEVPINFSLFFIFLFIYFIIETLQRSPKITETLHVFKQLSLYHSCSQTGVRGLFGVRKTIFWDREVHSKNQNDALEEKKSIK